MRKYIVFVFNFDNNGGLEDIKDSFDSLEDAKHYAESFSHFDTVYIVNRDTWEKVCTLDGENWI